MQGFDDLHTRSSPRTPKQLLEFKSFVFKNFDRLDLDRDGFLSQNEIETAISDSNRTLMEEEVLAFLLFRLKQISFSYAEEVAKPGCISRRDIEEFFAQFENQ
jgi:hypothetical protein